MRVVVLGAGSWGTTVASLLARRHPTLLWARDPEVADEVDLGHTNRRYLGARRLPPQLRATADLGKAVATAELLLVALPSAAVRDTLRQAAPEVHPWIPVVSLTKGFEAGTLSRITEVIREELPTHPAAVLTGPNIAREILAGQAAASVLAADDPAVAAGLQRVLRGRALRVYTNHDVVGCEVGGALKNVVAIACGIAEGRGMGDNLRAAVMTRGLAELTRLGVAMGGEAATFAGLTGMGDLVATCASPHSRNRQVGERLGRGEPLAGILASMTMVAEGVETAVVAHRLAARHRVDMPVAAAIHAVVTGRISAADAARGLRRAGHERDPG